MTTYQQFDYRARDDSHGIWVSRLPSELLGDAALFDALWDLHPQEFHDVRTPAGKWASDEEADAIRQLTEQLLGMEFTDRKGQTRPLDLEDILYIAPYNMQARRLQSVLPPGARVGSVDLFQGQQAPVVILSLCSSAGDFGSRGLGFILDRNRINVAISRAQCLAVVVGDPAIAHTTATSIDNMRCLNLMCRIAGA